MNEDKIKQFKCELKALLIKYDACIQFGCADCSDLYGLYDERIEVARRNSDEAYFSAQGYSLSVSDL